MSFEHLEHSCFLVTQKNVGVAFLPRLLETVKSGN